MKIQAQEILQAQQVLKDRLPEIQRWLADQKVDLEDRWEVYAMLAPSDLLPTKTYGDGNITELNSSLSLYDDFYIERYQTATYLDILRKLDEEEPGWQGITEAHIDRWKESVLREGYGDFTYDW